MNDSSKNDAASVYALRIERAMLGDARDAERLFDEWRIASDMDGFVAALIAALLVERRRRQQNR